MRLALFATFFHGGADASASASKFPEYTCGSLKEMWVGNGCCEDNTKSFEDGSFPTCAYDFSKPDCFHSGPQTPKDLTTTGLWYGNRFAAAPIMDRAQMNQMALVNVHWHLGAEHKSDAYGNDVMTKSNQAKPDGVNRVGWFGAALATNHDTNRAAAADVPDCVDTKVGDVIEVHWVHSSAGSDSWQDVDVSLSDESLLLSDGLGQAANGRSLLNPMVHVEATVYEIVADGTDAQYVFDPDGGLFMEHIPDLTADSDYVRYVGSSTGTSYTGDQTIYGQGCSPYVINWGVDRRLHNITSSSMSELCQKLKAKNIEKDLAPHSARVLVNKLFVSPNYEEGLGGDTAEHIRNIR